MKIGFITCPSYILQNFFPTIVEPDFVPVEACFTPDDQLAVDYLRHQGHTVEPVIWGSTIATLQHLDLLIVRSPWDYMDTDENKSQFLAWIDQLEKAKLPVLNPSLFMRWMLDKHYLKDLAENGVAVIPTTYYEKETTIDLLATFQQKGSFVLKPCISAAGIGLYHITTEQEAVFYQNEIEVRMQTASYMLQDFIPEITVNGEWSLIFLGGRYSHAVHKKTGPNSILVHAERGGSLHFSHPDEKIISFAKATYECIYPAFTKSTNKGLIPQSVLYLRLDVIDTKKGPVLIECEGVEPELFFRAQKNAPTVFYEAIQKYLRT